MLGMTLKLEKSDAGCKRYKRYHKQLTKGVFNVNHISMEDLGAHPNKFCL